MSFFRELQRRKVIRVAIAYAIVAWLLLQVSDTLVPALRLPEWFNSGVALLLILGLPVALLFAWAFDLTPDGIRRTRSDDEADQSVSSNRNSHRIIAVGTMLAIVFLSTIFWIPR